MSKRGWLASALILGLAVALLVMTLWSLDLARQLSRHDADHRAACDNAKHTALGALESEITFVELLKRRGHTDVMVSGASGVALRAVLDACGDRGDDHVKGVLVLLVHSLLMADDMEALERLVSALREAPLWEWKELTLPDQPSLWMMLAGGDSAEAAELERQFNEGLVKRDGAEGGE